MDSTNISTTQAETMRDRRKLVELTRKKPR
jgi:hypothetical protein